MSTIYGIVDKKGNPLSDSMKSKMIAAMQPRAVDRSGHWEDGFIMLGHSMLVTTREQQWETLPEVDHHYVITADVRLDNRSYLLKKLEIDPHAAQQIPDSGLLLPAFKKWKEYCTDHLEGEYVFCIWSRAEKKLFIATDQIGVRPLFYYDSPELFIFCSELKGVRCIKPGPEYFNAASLIEYFYRQSNTNETYDKDVQALRGSKHLILQDGKVAIKTYWAPEPLGKYKFTKDEEWIDCLRELMFRSIENRLRTDKPIGVMLSGGLDSTSITCMLAKVLAARNQSLHTFSSVLPVGYAGSDHDERKYIDLVGRFCPNINQTYVEAIGLHPFSDIDNSFEIDESFPNVFSYMDRAIAEKAAQKDIRIFFNGYGGDFWVSSSGCKVVYKLLRNRQFRTAWPILKALRAQDNNSWLKILKREYIAHLSIYKRLAEKKSPLATFAYNAVHRHWTDTYSVDLSNRREDSITAHMQHVISSGKWSVALGMLANRYGHYNMLSATPLTDKAICEFLMDVPVTLFRKGGYTRSLIRHAMDKVIPPQIQWRKDKGYYSPDFATRVLSQRQAIDKVLYSDDYLFAFDNYLNKSSLYSYISIADKKSLSKTDEHLLITIAQIIIAAEILLQLKNRDYNID